MNFVELLVTLATFFAPTFQNPAGDSKGLTITHLANEGFLLSDGEHTVIIDCLFAPGIPPYRTLSPEFMTSLKNATPPFDGV
ncbi:MAG: hypothetical protein O7G85_17160, partial [Planctomycetota bacterium]|nr:hypothetical protein [Planctomycetota bacterium]